MAAECRNWLGMPVMRFLPSSDGCGSSCPRRREGLRARPADGPVVRILVYLSPGFPPRPRLGTVELRGLYPRLAIRSALASRLRLAVCRREAISLSSPQQVWSENCLGLRPMKMARNFPWCSVLCVAGMYFPHVVCASTSQGRIEQTSPGRQPNNRCRRTMSATTAEGEGGRVASTTESATGRPSRFAGRGSPTLQAAHCRERVEIRREESSPARPPSEHRLMIDTLELDVPSRLTTIRQAGLTAGVRGVRTRRLA